MKKIAAAVVCAGALPTFADYSCELGVEYLSGMLDGGFSYEIPEYTPPTGGEEVPTPPPVESGSISDSDYDGWRASGTFYFDPVDASVGPLRLAPFIDRASSVGGQYGQADYDDIDLETTFWELEARVVVNRISLEAHFGGAEVDGDLLDDDVDLFGAAVGYYVGETTEIKASLSVENADQAEYDRWAIEVNHVAQLENGMTWNGRLLYGFVHGDHDLFRDVDGADVEVQFSWFFNHSTGVGVDYALRDRDDAGESDEIRLWANYFPTDKISLELSYYSEENDDIDLESDGWEIEAKYRL